MGHSTATRTVLADATVDRVDAGSGAGKLRFYTAGFGTQLCEIALADPAFGAASSGTATLLGVPLEGVCSGGGTIAKFRFLDSDLNEVFTGDVAASGSDINLNNPIVSTNDVVRITGLTYSAPA